MFSPAFQFYPKQWLADDNVLLMDLDAQALHLRCMCLAWQQDPPCTLPDDDDMLRKWCGNPQDWDRIKSQIFRAWRKDGDRWVQDGLLRELTKQLDLREKRQAAAEKRWSKKPKCKQKGCKKNAKAMPRAGARSEEEIEVEDSNPSSPKKGGAGGRFVPPTVAEVQALSNEKGYNLNAEKFVNFYASKDWMVGRNKMKSWPHAAAGAREWCQVKGKNPAMHVGASESNTAEEAKRDAKEYADNIEAVTKKLDQASLSAMGNMELVATVISAAAKQVKAIDIADRGSLFGIEGELIAHCYHALPAAVRADLDSRTNAIVKKSGATGDALERSRRSLCDREVRILLGLPRLSV